MEAQSMKKEFLILTTSLLFTSCSMMPERSYLSQMDESEDEGFMVPGQDFPVVAGDSGMRYRSRRDVLKRTPSSSLDKEKYYHETYLEDELEQLVEEQPEDLKDHFRNYEYKLSSTSEKIYFLKLETLYERNEYLESKGILTSNSSRSIASSDSAQTLNTIAQGMTKEEVSTYWGQPYSIEVAGNPKYENERWAYKRKGHVEYVYFESGKVEGWKKNR